MDCFNIEHYLKLVKEMGLEGEEAEKAANLMYTDNRLELEKQAQRNGSVTRAKLYGKIEKVPGDGDCMFTCIGKALDEFRKDIPENLRSASSIRESITDFILGNRDDYSLSFVDGAFDEYIKKLRCKGVYGDNHVLNAAANMYQLTFFIVTDSTDIIIYPEHGTSYGAAYFCYTGNHYDNIIAD